MSTKQIVQDLLEQLPDHISLHDVARKIEFVAAVRQGLGEVERGERIPIEEIESELMPLERFEATEETACLLKTPKNAKRIMGAIAQLEAKTPVEGGA